MVLPNCSDRAIRKGIEIANGRTLDLVMTAFVASAEETVPDLKGQVSPALILTGALSVPFVLFQPELYSQVQRHAHSGNARFNISLYVYFFLLQWVSCYRSENHHKNR